MLEQSFVRAAGDFCAWVEQNAGERASARDAARLLASLYRAALDLPEVEPATSDIDLPAVEKIEPVMWAEDDCYWEVFDPYTHDEPVAGSLEDDLSDIYLDVKPPLLVLKNDPTNIDAIWHLRFGFESHWGDHLVDALRALQRAMLRAVPTD